MWIKTMVDGIIEEFQTRDIFHIVESLNIPIIKKDMKNKKGKFMRTMYGDEFIFIHEDLNEYEAKVIIAHELGHALLHTDLNTEYYTKTLVSKNKLELQANKFAAELLIPDKIDLNLDINDTLSISDLSRLLKVPEEFIKLKFDNEYRKNEIQENDFYIDLF